MGRLPFRDLGREEQKALNNQRKTTFKSRYHFII